MAEILNDKEIEKLIGNVIISGDFGCVHPNSYILRLGEKGEFINSGKEFSLGKNKKGISIQPGHSVALIAYETIDFTRETVHKIYPDHDLHGIVSPTTDLSREGIVAPTTQIDAGYNGTLNWTITNTSNEVRRFIYQENIFRLMIFKLGRGETPEQVYKGEYQNQTGYVPSKRKGPPVGMKESEWEDSMIEGGPEKLLENLIKSGYPWNILGKKLAAIDDCFKDVTNEYSHINESINNLKKEMTEIKQKQNNIPNDIKIVMSEMIPSMQNRWLIKTGSFIFVLLGLFISAINSAGIRSFLSNYGPFVGLTIIIISIIIGFGVFKKK